MVEREARYTLTGNVQGDDAYLRGERTGGKAGRGSENKVPFIAAVALNTGGKPLYVKMAPVPDFTRKAIAVQAGSSLSSGCLVSSEGLACFAGVTDAGCVHKRTVVGGRKSKELPEFHWSNTVLGKLKTSFGGAYHAFDFAKYGLRCLATFAYRFNRRFKFHKLSHLLLVPAATIGPRPAAWLRNTEASC